MAKSRSDKTPHTDLERLESLKKSKKGLIPFETNLRDKEFPQISYSIYGAVKTNELFIAVTNGKLSFAKAIPSPLLHPAMADRIFGIDMMDMQAAGLVAEQLWAKHKTELLNQRTLRAK